MPYQSTKDLITEAAKQLTHEILHPQLAGPFAQVDGDQMLVLERLAAISECPLPKHRWSHTPPPPSEIDDSDTPPRMHIKFSHLRVQKEAIHPRMV
jgi:hypothetical protein